MRVFLPTPFSKHSVLFFHRFPTPTTPVGWLWLGWKLSSLSWTTPQAAMWQLTAGFGLRVHPCSAQLPVPGLLPLLHPVLSWDHLRKINLSPVSASGDLGFHVLPPPSFERRAEVTRLSKAPTTVPVVQEVLQKYQLLFSSEVGPQCQGNPRECYRDCKQT